MLLEQARHHGQVLAAEPGIHVVRVSFGAQGEAPATAELDDAGTAALALREASALLGVPLTVPVLRADGTQISCHLLIESVAHGAAGSLYLAWIGPAAEPAPWLDDRPGARPLTQAAPA